MMFVRFTIAVLLFLFVGCEPNANTNNPVITTVSESTNVIQVSSEPEEVELQNENVEITAPDVLFHADLESIFEASAQGSARLFDDQAQSRAFIQNYLGSISGHSRVVQMFGESVELAQLQYFDAGVWLVEESVLMVVNPESFAVSFENGGAPVLIGESGMRAARRQNHVLIGIGDKFEEALDLNRERSEDYFSAPEEVWNGASGISSSSLLHIVVQNYRMSSVLLREELEPFSEMEIDSVAFRFDTLGEAELLFHAQNNIFLQQSLAQAQATSRLLLGEFERFFPPSMDVLHAYVELIYSSFWSRLRLSTENEVTRLRLLGSSCGNPMRNLFIIALIRGLSLYETEEAVEADAEYENQDFTVAPTCVELQNHLPALSERFLGLARDSSEASFLAILDPTAVAAANLPTFFELLPFSISQEQIEAVFGDDFVGSLEQASEIGAFWGNAETQYFSLVIPEASAVYLPPIPDFLVSGVVEDLGFVVASPSFLDLSEEESEQVGSEQTEVVEVIEVIEVIEVEPVEVEPNLEQVESEQTGAVGIEPDSEQIESEQAEVVEVEPVELSLRTVLQTNHNSQNERENWDLNFEALPAETAAVVWINHASIQALAELLDDPGSQLFTSHVTQAQIAISKEADLDIVLTLDLPSSQIMVPQVENTLRSILANELFPQCTNDLERFVLEFAVNALTAQVNVAVVSPNKMHLTFDRSGSYVALVTLVWLIEHFKE